MRLVIVAAVVAACSKPVPEFTPTYISDSKKWDALIWERCADADGTASDTPEVLIFDEAVPRSRYIMRSRTCARLYGLHATNVPLVATGAHAPATAAAGSMRLCSLVIGPYDAHSRLDLKFLTGLLTDRDLASEIAIRVDAMRGRGGGDYEVSLSVRSVRVIVQEKQNFSLGFNGVRGFVKLDGCFPLRPTEPSSIVLNNTLHYK